MNFLNAKQYAGKLEISQRRVEILCKEGRIPGAQKIGTGLTSAWIIPASAQDPRMSTGRPLGQKNIKKKRTEN